MAIAAELAAAENISEFDDDYLQDDIPIDEDDDDSGDGIEDDIAVGRLSEDERDALLKK